ncbi:FmdB family transcriptional regulator [Micromonospora musae]|uniref:FmdB family transcriptional regulator n=1 Tax=Micromonospora musae TaxID=1894970 RepID=A0A3A9XM74_9ACTN|nr:FmdB family transcriptional regulator [Micromonospora musae]RKN25693.1 FmdB family transcriptional regulator [Micromonospora musae]
MPTYQYACTSCGRQLEAVQSFSDAPLTECPECAGRLRKVFNSVGIVFKGSGFYRTDSRSSGSDTVSASSDGGKSTKSDSSSSASSSTKSSGSSGSSGSNGSSGSSGSSSNGSSSSKTPAASSSNTSSSS